MDCFKRSDASNAWRCSGGHFKEIPESPNDKVPATLRKTTQLFGMNVCQPRSSGDREHSHQSQQSEEPLVFPGEANLAKALLATSRSFRAQRVAHVLRPPAKQAIKLNLDFDSHLWAPFAFPAKCVVHTMGEDHATASRERDSNFDSVRGNSISEVRSETNQHHPEHRRHKDSFPLMPSVPKTDRRSPNDRHEDCEQSMSMFFRR